MVAQAKVPRFVDPEIELVWSVLNRQVPVDTLVNLVESFSNERPPTAEAVLFGFDTNAIFEVGRRGNRGATAVDEISRRKGKGLVLPGQVVQELWNNHFSASGPKLKPLKRKYTEVIDELNSAGFLSSDEFDGAARTVERTIDKLDDWVDPESLRIFSETLKALVGIGCATYVPRFEFSELANVRHATKTPPGFDDKGVNHGDFFVWADFLLGVARSDLNHVDSIVFVTQEKKRDWRVNGRTHPILTAEATAVSERPFALWDVDEFVEYAVTTAL